MGADDQKGKPSSAAELLQKKADAQFQHNNIESFKSPLAQELMDEQSKEQGKYETEVKKPSQTSITKTQEAVKQKSDVLLQETDNVPTLKSPATKNDGKVQEVGSPVVPHGDKPNPLPSGQKTEQVVPQTQKGLTLERNATPEVQGLEPVVGKVKPAGSMVGSGGESGFKTPPTVNKVQESLENLPPKVQGNQKTLPGTEKAPTEIGQKVPDSGPAKTVQVQDSTKPGTRSDVEKKGENSPGTTGSAPKMEPENKGSVDKGSAEPSKPDQKPTGSVVSKDEKPVVAPIEKQSPTNAVPDLNKPSYEKQVEPKQPAQTSKSVEQQSPQAKNIDTDKPSTGSNKEIVKGDWQGPKDQGKTESTVKGIEDLVNKANEGDKGSADKHEPGKQPESKGKEPGRGEELGDKGQNKGDTTSSGKEQGSKIDTGTERTGKERQPEAKIGGSEKPTETKAPNTGDAHAGTKNEPHETGSESATKGQGTTSQGASGGRISSGGGGGGDTAGHDGKEGTKSTANDGKDHGPKHSTGEGKETSTTSGGKEVPTGSKGNVTTGDVRGDSGKPISSTHDDGGDAKTAKTNTGSKVDGSKIQSDGTRIETGKDSGLSGVKGEPGKDSSIGGARGGSSKDPGVFVTDGKRSPGSAKADAIADALVEKMDPKKSPKEDGPKSDTAKEESSKDPQSIKARVEQAQQKFDQAQAKIEEILKGRNEPTQGKTEKGFEGKQPPDKSVSQQGKNQKESERVPPTDKTKSPGGIPLPGLPLPLPELGIKWIGQKGQKVTEGTKGGAIETDKSSKTNPGKEPTGKNSITGKASEISGSLPIQRANMSQARATHGVAPTDRGTDKGPVPTVTVKIDSTGTTNIDSTKTVQVPEGRAMHGIAPTIDEKVARKQDPKPRDPNDAFEGKLPQIKLTYNKFEMAVHPIRGGFNKVVTDKVELKNPHEVHQEAEQNQNVETARKTLRDIFARFNITTPRRGFTPEISESGTYRVQKGQSSQRMQAFTSSAQLQALTYNPSSSRDLFAIDFAGTADGAFDEANEFDETVAEEAARKHADLMDEFLHRQTEPTNQDEQPRRVYVIQENDTPEYIAVVQLNDESLCELIREINQKIIQRHFDFNKQEYIEVLPVGVMMLLPNDKDIEEFRNR